MDKDIFAVQITTPSTFFPLLAKYNFPILLLFLLTLLSLKLPICLQVGAEKYELAKSWMGGAHKVPLERVKCTVAVNCSEMVVLRSVEWSL